MRPASWVKAAALTFTVLAHLFFLLGVGQHRSVAKTPPAPAAATLTVSLLPEPAVAAIAPITVAEPVLSLPAEPFPPAAPEREPAPELPAVQEQAETPPHFFQLPELTSPPTVAEGLVRGEYLVLPGTSGGYISVRFWINALGEVVRAQLVGVDGNEDEEEKLLAALRQVRFLPARVGHLAVHSELQMELRVARNAGL